MRDVAERFRRARQRGGFLAFMIVVGLNNYQLKGKAQDSYWPAVRRRMLDARAVPKTPSQLESRLRPLFAKERLFGRKLMRAKRFLGSALARELWESTPRRAAREIKSSWSELAETMGQRGTAKTIAFATKMMAVGLLLLGTKKFDFSGIPLPVDSRVRKLTACLPTERDIQSFWDRVLERIRRREPRVTHLHLDAFLWHYADAGDKAALLKDLGVSRPLRDAVTRRLADLSEKKN